MENQQSYSHGLLYSVAPENFSALQLRDKDGKDEFDWEAYESQYEGDTFMQAILNFLKATAVSWGIIKLH
jgi:hypothetical protein